MSGSGVSVTLGTGAGSFTAGGMDATQNISINAAQFGGTIDVGAVSASGVTITTGTRGDLVQLDGFNITVDGAAGVSGNATVLWDLSANGAISIGLGNATIHYNQYADASKSFTLSATGRLQVLLLLTKLFRHRALQ